MRIPRCTLAALLVLPALSVSAAPRLSPVIVQGAGARAAVESVIAQAGVGSVGDDLPLVNGVSAKLTSTEIRLLTSYAVTSDSEVRTSGKPAPTPRQLDNVFRTVTGATAVPGLTGAGVGVAVVDTGVASLPDFGSRLRTGVDLSGEGNAQLDGFGHGTFVAGLVAGDGSSDPDYVGEAPGAHVVPVKVAGRTGTTNVSTVIRGLQWVVDNADAQGIRVVNLSVGAVPQGPTALNPLDQAVEAVWQAGIVVVASAGNSGPARGTVTSPGDDPLVVTVGALDTKDTVPTGDDVVPGFSSNGPTSWDGWWKPDLLAPGKSVVSVMPTTSTSWLNNKGARVGTRNFVGSGTSFSAAIVSGAAALLLEDDSSRSPDEVKAALLTTTNQGPGTSNDPFQQGHGVLDVARAAAEPLVSMVQDVSGIPVPLAGAPISLLVRQGVSTWASRSLVEQVYYGGAWPFPYSGPATTSVDGVSPLFQSSAWNSSAWNSSAWNSSAWNSSAWNSSAWNSSAWNSSAWNSGSWG